MILAGPVRGMFGRFVTLVYKACEMREYILIYLMCITFGFILCNAEFSTESTKTSFDFKQTNECGGEYVILGTMDGVLTALDFASGEKCWSTLLDTGTFLSSSLSNLEVFEDGNRIWLVPSLDGSLFKYDGAVLQPLPVNVDSLLMHTETLDHNTTVTGGKYKQMYGINRQTGEIHYKCSVNGCESFKKWSADDVLVVEAVVQSVNAVDSVKAEKRWHFRVVELVLKGTAPADYNHGASENKAKASSESNALIPTNKYYNLNNLDTVKISLHNGVAGKIDQSTLAFSWIYKTHCPIIDAWHVKEKVVHLLDPFDNESSFFSVDTDGGRYSALLFLGSYMDQLFVKQSKKLKIKNLSQRASTPELGYQAFSLPVMKSNLHDDSIKYRVSNALMSTSANFNDYGYYFFINSSVTENATHCFVDKKDDNYEEPFDEYYWLGIIAMSSIFCITVIRVAITKYYLDKKEYVNASTSSLELMTSPGANAIENKSFTSRFQEDFELIAVLGRGGFGVVMEVKNKIDDCYYAVKRIRIHFSGKSKMMQLDFVMREVKALAKLDHPGIVRYFNAWVENPPKGWQECKDQEENIVDITQNCPNASESCAQSPNKQTVSSNKVKVLNKLKENPLNPFKDITVNNLQSDFEIIDNSHSMQNSVHPFGLFVKPSDLSCSSSYSENSIHNSNISCSSQNDAVLLPSESKCIKTVDDANILAEDLVNKNYYIGRENNESVHEEEMFGTEIHTQTYDGQSSLGDDCVNSFSTDFRYSKEVALCENNVQVCHSNKSSHKRNIDLCSCNQTQYMPLVAENCAQTEADDEGDSEPAYLYIQMQLCRKESLSHWLYRNSSSRNYQEVMIIFYQIIEAVEYVHACGLMHRDLKPSNIYFSLDGAIKIGDFGLATSSEIGRQACEDGDIDFPHLHTCDVGTALYMSPEQSLKKTYDCKTDIFSLGIIFFELLVPLATFNERYRVLKSVRKLEFPNYFLEKYPKESILLRQLLNNDPVNRPTAYEIKEHPLFQPYRTVQ